MENLQLNELKLLKAAMNAFSASARSDEPHWSYEPEFKVLMEKINTAIAEDERETDNKRRAEAEDAERSDSEKQNDDF